MCSIETIKGHPVPIKRRKPYFYNLIIRSSLGIAKDQLSIMADFALFKGNAEAQNDVNAYKGIWHSRIRLETRINTNGGTWTQTSSITERDFTILRNFSTQLQKRLSQSEVHWKNWSFEEEVCVVLFDYENHYSTYSSNDPNLPRNCSSITESLRSVFCW